MTWLEIAQKYPEQKESIIEHVKDNIRHNKDLIKFKNSEIGCMVKLRNTFPRSNAVGDWTRYFINLHTADIERMTGEIEDARREIDEITRL